MSGVCECAENFMAKVTLSRIEIPRSSDQKKILKGIGHQKDRKSDDEMTYKVWRPKALRSSWTSCLLEDDREAGVLQTIQTGSVAVAGEEKGAKAKIGRRSPSLGQK